MPAMRAIAASQTSVSENCGLTSALHPIAAVRASQEARQTRERERFLAIVCTDNPYAAVWQPAEGTCERFAATVGN